MASAPKYAQLTLDGKVAAYDTLAEGKLLAQTFDATYKEDKDTACDWVMELSTEQQAKLVQWVKSPDLADTLLLAAIERKEICMTEVGFERSGGGGADCMQDRKNAMEGLFRTMEKLMVATDASKALAQRLKPLKENYGFGQLHEWYEVCANEIEAFANACTLPKLKSSLVAGLERYGVANLLCADKVCIVNS